MNRNKIVLGLGIIAFIVGFIFVSLVSFLANTRDLGINDLEPTSDFSELKIRFENEARCIRTSDFNWGYCYFIDETSKVTLHNFI
jgi:hypothetical protein